MKSWEKHEHAGREVWVRFGIASATLYKDDGAWIFVSQCDESVQAFDLGQHRRPPLEFAERLWGDIDQALSDRINADVDAAMGRGGAAK